MPYLVNGIGTHYYGKKNLQTRPGPCPHCGRAVELKSYDTRTWFVIFLIPIIPLKRLRIVDYCSACTKHYAMAIDKWETAKQLEISGALEKYRATPTPEAAMAAHQQLLNFHQLEEAKAFRKLMREKYPDNAKVHAYLGSAMEHFGQQDEATACYQHAFELRSDLPEARIGVARGHIQAGKLTEARALLDFLEKPGASQLYSLEPLDTLARANQSAERHEEALALFAIIQKELPNLNEQRWFRDLIYKSEKALKRSASQVPKQKFSWKRFCTEGNASNARALGLFGIIAAVIALGFVIANEYIRRHRTVYIVNAYQQAATVQIDGGEPVKIHGLGEITLAEGRHRAIISGPLQQAVDFEIKEGYWRRWFSDPVWVLNLGGAAVLNLSHVTYARNDPPPPVTAFSFGENFQRFPDVTHPFQELPEKVQVKSGQTKTLTHLDVMRSEPIGLFYYYYQQKNLPEAWRLAEWSLKLHPEDEDLLALYAQLAAASGQTERVEKFLRPGLTNRPVWVQWHRYYQNLHRGQAHEAVMAAEYRAELEKDPNNSALLYLLGRVVPTRAESRMLFDRACQADTNNAFAYYARAYDRVSVGDWPGARPLLAHACALRPGQTEFAEQFQITRFVLGEFADLEKELRADLQKHSLNQSTCQRLCDVLVAQGRNTDATTVVAEFKQAAAPYARTMGEDPGRTVHQHLLYLTGDFATLEKETVGARDANNKYTRFIALTELGRVEEAIKLLPAEPQNASNPFHFLNTAIALRAVGNGAEAARWQELGIAALEQGNADFMRAAKMLRRTTPPRLEETEEFSLPAASKATILALLAQQHPSARRELLPLIARLNVVPGYPQHLIQQTMAKLK
jgi:tetratricopeptide (TPR) repeat protein